MDEKERLKREIESMKKKQLIFLILGIVFFAISLVFLVLSIIYLNTLFILLCNLFGSAGIVMIVIRFGIFSLRIAARERILRDDTIETGYNNPQEFERDISNPNDEIIDVESKPSYKGKYASIIAQYKILLDEGKITQEEFDAKKEELEKY